MILLKNVAKIIQIPEIREYRFMSGIIWINFVMQRKIADNSVNNVVKIIKNMEYLGGIVIWALYVDLLRQLYFRG